MAAGFISFLILNSSGGGRGCGGHVGLGSFVGV